MFINYLLNIKGGIMKKALFLKNIWFLAILFIAFSSSATKLSAALKDDVLTAINNISNFDPAALAAELKKQENIVSQANMPYGILGQDSFKVEEKIFYVIKTSMNRAMWQSVINNINDPWEKDTNTLNRLQNSIAIYQDIISLIDQTTASKLLTGEIRGTVRSYKTVIQGHIRNAQYFLNNPNKATSSPSYLTVNFGDEVYIRNLHTREYLGYTEEKPTNYPEARYAQMTEEGNTIGVPRSEYLKNESMYEGSLYKEASGQEKLMKWKIENAEASASDGTPITTSSNVRIRNVVTDEVLFIPNLLDGKNPYGLVPGTSVLPIFLSKNKNIGINIWQLDDLSGSNTLKTNMPFRINSPTGNTKGYHIHALDYPSPMEVYGGYHIKNDILYSNVFGLKPAGTATKRGNELWYISEIATRAKTITPTSNTESVLNKKLQELIDNFSTTPDVIEKTMPLLLNTNFNDESKTLGNNLVTKIYLNKTNNLEQKAQQVKLLKIAITSPYLKQNSTTYTKYIKTLEADILKIELNNQLQAINDTKPVSAFYDRAFSEMPTLFNSPIYNSSSSWIGNNVMTKIYNKRSSLNLAGKQTAINLLTAAQTCAYLENYKSKYAGYISTIQKELKTESKIEELNNKLSELQSKPISVIISSLPIHLPKTTYNSQTTNLGHGLVDKVFKERSSNNADSLEQTKSLIQKATNSPYLSTHKNTYQGWINDINKEIEAMPRPQGTESELKYGDIISIGTTVNSSKFLWSESNKNYFHPTSSRQQMVGLDTQINKNTLWKIQGPDNTENNYRKGQPVYKGDIISLKHIASGEYLHSHDQDRYGHKAPYTTSEQEVTCAAMNDDGEFIINFSSDTTCKLGRPFTLKHRNSNRNIIDATSSDNQGEYTDGKREVYAGTTTNSLYFRGIYTEQEANFLKSQEPLVDGSNIPSGTASTPLKYGDVIYLKAQDSQYAFWGQSYAKSNRSSTALLLLTDSTPTTQDNMFVIRPEHGKGLDSKAGQIINNNDTIQLQHLLTGAIIYYVQGQNPYLENISQTTPSSSDFLLVQIDAPMGIVDAKKVVYLRHKQSGRYLYDTTTLEPGFNDKYKLIGTNASSGIQNSTLKINAALQITPAPKMEIPVIRPEGTSNELKYGDTISVNGFHGATTSTYLWSEKGKRYSHPKTSGQQMVGMSEANHSNTLWRIVGPAGATVNVSGTPLTYNQAVTFKESNTNTFMYSNQSTYSSTKDMYKAQGRTEAITSDNEFSIIAQHGQGSTYKQGNPISHGDTVRIIHNELGAYMIYSGGRGFMSKKSSPECDFKILDADDKTGPLTSTSRIILKHIDTGRFLQNSSGWYSLLSTSRKSGTTFTVQSLGQSKEQGPTIFEEGKRVLNGDKISLQHVESGFYLHSHKLSQYGKTAPYSTSEQEVTAHNQRNSSNNFIISYNGESLKDGRAFSLKHADSSWFVETHPTNKGSLTDNKYEVYATQDYNDGNKMVLHKIHTAASIKAIKENEAATNNINKQIEAIINLARNEIMNQLPPLFSSTNYDDTTGSLAHQGVKKVYEERDVKNSADNIQTTTFLNNAQNAAYLAYKKNVYAKWINQLADEKKIIDEIIQLNQQLNDLYKKPASEIITELPQYFNQANYDETTTTKASRCLNKVINKRDKQSKANLLDIKDLLQKSTTAEFLKEKASHYQSWVKRIESEIDVLNTIQQLNDQIKDIGTKGFHGIIAELTPLLPTKNFNDQTTTLAHQAITKAYNNRKKTDPNLLDKLISFLEAAQQSPYLVDQSTSYTEWISQCSTEKEATGSIASLNNIIKEIGAKNAPQIAQELPPHLEKTPFNNQTTELANAAINKSFNQRNKNNQEALSATKALLDSALSSPYLTSQYDAYNTMLETITKDNARLNAISDLNNQIQTATALTNPADRAQGLLNIVNSDKNRPSPLNNQTQQLLEQGLVSVMSSLPELTEPKDQQTLETFKTLIQNSSVSRLLAEENQQKAPNRLAALDAAINQIKLTAANFDELLAQLILMIQQAQDKPFPSLAQQNFTNGLKFLNSMIDGLSRPDLVKLKDFLVSIALKFPGLIEADNNYIQKTMLPNINTRITLMDQNKAINDLNNQIQNIIAENADAIMTKLPPLFPSTAFNNDTTTLANNGVQKVFNARKRLNLSSLRKTQTFLSSAIKSPYLASEKQAYEANMATLNNEITRLNAISNLNKQLIEISKKSAADIKKEMPPLFPTKPFNAKTDDHAHVGIDKVYNARNQENIPQLQSVITFLQQANKSPYMTTRKTTYDNWIKQVNKEITNLQSINSLNNQIKEINAKPPQSIITELPPLFLSQPYNATTTTLGHAGVNKAVRMRNKLSIPSLNQTIAFIKKAQASPYLLKHKETYSRWIKVINQERESQLSISQLNTQLQTIGTKDAADIIKEMSPLLPSTPFNSETTQLGHATATKVYNQTRSKNPSIARKSIAFFEEAKKSPYLAPHVKTYDTYIKNLNDNIARWQLNSALNQIAQQPAAEIITQLPPHLSKTIFNNYSTKKGHETVTKAFTERNKNDVESLTATQKLLEQAKTSPFLQPHIEEYNKFLAEITKDLAGVNAITALNSQIEVVNKNTSIKTKAQGLLDIIKTKSSSPFNSTTQSLMAAGINDLGSKIDSLVNTQQLPTLQLLSTLMAEGLKTPLLTQPEKGKIPGYQAKIDAAAAKIQLSAGNLDEKIQFLKDLLMQAGGKPLNPFMQQTFSATLEDITAMIPSLSKPDLIKLKDFLTTIVLRSPSVGLQDKDYIQKNMLPALSKRITEINQENAIQVLNQKIQTIISQNAPTIIAELPQHFDAQLFNNDTTTLAHSGVTKAVQKRNKNNRKNLVNTRNFVTAAQKAAYLNDKTPTYTSWITTINNEIKEFDAVNNLNKKLQEIISKERAAIMAEMPAHFSAKNYNNTSTLTAHKGVEKVFNERIKHNAPDLRQTKAFILKAQESAYLASQKQNYTAMIKTLDDEINKQQSIFALNKKIIAIIAKNSAAIMAELPPLFSAKPFNNATTAKGHEGVIKVYNNQQNADLGLLGTIKDFLEKAVTSEYLAPHKAAYTKMISDLNTQIKGLSSVNSLNEQLAQVGKKPVPDIIKELPGLFPIKPFDQESTQLGHAAVNKVYLEYRTKNPTLMQQTVTLLQKAQECPYLEKQKATYTNWINALNNNIARWKLNASLAKVRSLPVNEIIKQLPPLLSKTPFNGTSTNRAHAAVNKVYLEYRTKNPTLMQQTVTLLQKAQECPYLEKQKATYTNWINALNNNIARWKLNASLAKVRSLPVNEIIKQLPPLLSKTPFNGTSTNRAHASVIKVFEGRTASDLTSLQATKGLIEEAKKSPYLQSKIAAYDSRLAILNKEIRALNNLTSLNDQIKAVNANTDINTKAQGLLDIITTLGAKTYDNTSQTLMAQGINDLGGKISLLNKPKDLPTLNVLAKLMQEAQGTPLLTSKEKEKLQGYQNAIAAAITRLQMSNASFDEQIQKIKDLITTAAGQPLNTFMEQTLLDILKNLTDQVDTLSKDQLINLKDFITSTVIKSPSLSPAIKDYIQNNMLPAIQKALDSIKKQEDLAAQQQAIAALNKQLAQIKNLDPNEIITKLTPLLPNNNNAPFNEQSSNLTLASVRKVFNSRDPNNLSSLEFIKPFLQAAEQSPLLKKAQPEIQEMINKLNNEIKAIKDQMSKEQAVNAFQKRMNDINAVENFTTRAQQHASVIDEYNKTKPLPEIQSIFDNSIRKLIQQLNMNNLSHVKTMLTTMQRAATSQLIKPTLQETIKAPIIPNLQAAIKRLESQDAANKLAQEQEEAAAEKAAELAKAPFDKKLSILMALLQATVTPLDPYMASVVSRTLRELFVQIEDLTESQLKQLREFLTDVILQSDSLSFDDRTFASTIMIPAIDEAIDAITLKKNEDATKKQQFTSQQKAIAAFQKQMTEIDAIQNFDNKIQKLDALVANAQGKTFIPEIQNIYASSISKLIPLMSKLSLKQLNKLDGFLSRTQDSPLLGEAQRSYVMNTMKLLLQQQKAKLQAANKQQPIENDSTKAEAAAQGEREATKQAEAEKQKALAAFTKRINLIDEEQNNSIKFSQLAKEMYATANNVIYPEMQSRMTQSLSKLNRSIPELSEDELARLEVVLKQAQVTQLLNPAQKSYILPPLYTAIENRRRALQQATALSQTSATEQERLRLEQEQAAAEQQAQKQAAAQKAQQAEQEQDALNAFVKALNPIIKQTNIEKKLAGLITLTKQPPVNLTTPAIQQQYMMALMPLYQNSENRTAPEITQMKELVKLIQSTPLVPATQRPLVITQLTFAIDDAQRNLDEKTRQLTIAQQQTEKAAEQASAQEAANRQAEQQAAIAKQNRLTTFKAQINTMNALTNNDEKIAGLRQIMINTQTDGLPIYEEMQNLFFNSIMNLASIIPTASITTLNNLGALLQIAAQSPLLSSERQPQAQELFDKQVKGQIAYLQQAGLTQAQQDAQQKSQDQKMATFNAQLNNISAQLDFASRITAYQQFLTNAQGKTFSPAEQGAFAQNLEQFYNQASTFSQPQLAQTIQLIQQTLGSTLLNEPQKSYIKSTVIPNLTNILNATPTYTKTTQTQIIGQRRDSGRQPVGRITRGQTSSPTSKAATFAAAKPQERSATPATRSGIVEPGTTQRQTAETTTDPRQRSSQATTETRPRVQQQAPASPTTSITTTIPTTGQTNRNTQSTQTRATTPRAAQPTTTRATTQPAQSTTSRRGSPAPQRR